MKLIKPINSGANKEKALAVIDSLKTAVESGDVAGFACITISKADKLEVYVGNVTGIKKLKICRGCKFFAERVSKWRIMIRGNQHAASARKRSYAVLFCIARNTLCFFLTCGACWANT